MGAIDQTHPDRGLLQHLVQRDPVHTGELHRKGVHPVRLKPVLQPEKFPCHRAKPFRRPTGNRHANVLAADVAGSRLRIDDPQHRSEADARAQTTSKRQKLPNGMTGHPSGLAKQNPTMVRNHSLRRALMAPNR